MAQQNNYYQQSKRRQKRNNRRQFQQNLQNQHNHYYHDQQNQDYYQQQPSQHQYQQQHKQKPPVSDDKLLVIDGSVLEGGGQILRNSTTFAALLKKAIHITKIRAKRSTPGLRKQHSKGIELVNKINGGYLEGDYVKSMDVKYYPNEKPSYLNYYTVDIETAGSVALLVQTCLPLLLFSPLQCSLTCIGGTNASFAPQIDWFILILQPMLKRLMNISVDIRCIQRGFFPKGGGKVVMKTNPIESIPCFDLTKRGNLVKIYGHVIIGGRGFGLEIGDEIIRGAVRELHMTFGKKIPIHLEVLHKHKVDSFSDGIGVVIVAETDTGCLFGGSSLKGPSKGGRGRGGGRGGRYGGYNDYEQRENFEEVGRVAARELIADWKSTKDGCTDRHLQDQLIIFMALAKGKSKMATCALELHTETAIYIAEMMTGVKFEISNSHNGTVLIECEGIGYTPNMKWEDLKGTKGVKRVEQKENDDKLNEENNNNDEPSKKKDSFLKNRPSLF